MKNKKLREMISLLETAESSLKKMNKRIEELNNLKNIQSVSGNWDYDHYMHGMYNAMELFLGMLEGREIVYKNPPEVWCKDKPGITAPITQAEI